MKTVLRQKKQGFALVIALMLMSFVLVIMVSISVLVNVETTNAGNTLSQLRAREAAKLALMLAIGDLQRYAGPDQRVTARADILGDGNYAPEAKYWTGVWDTGEDKKGDPPKWLVSGENVDPEVVPSEKLLLLGNESTRTSDPTFQVEAESIALLGYDNIATAQMAWWISDEGIKASVGISPQKTRPASNLVESATNTSLPFLLSSAHGIQELFPSYDPFTSDSNTRLNEAKSVEQLNLLNDIDLSAINASEPAFHSLTLNSYGVLASVADDRKDGLMRDLSLYPSLLGSGFEKYTASAEGKEAEISARTDRVDQLTDQISITPLDDITSIINGSIEHFISPIISNLMIAFTIRSEEVNSVQELRLRMVFFCELWNPYTSTLEIDPSKSSPAQRQLELHIEGLPSVRMESLTNNGMTGYVDIQNVIGDSTNNGALVIALEDRDDDPWYPGRSKNWTGVNADENAGASPYISEIRDNGSKSWNTNVRKLGEVIGIQTGVTGIDSSSIKITSANSHKLDINLYLNDNGNRKLLQKLEGIQYGAVEAAHPTTSKVISSSHGSMTFGYHIAINEPRNSSDDTEYPGGVWLLNYDVRNPKPNFFSDWIPAYDPEFDIGSPYFPVIDGDQVANEALPHNITQLGSNTIGTTSFARLLDRSWSNDNSMDTLWQDVPLFELPRNRPFSLGSLQHLYFHNERPFKVGNSWGKDGDTNTLKWFDDYYFSGFTRSAMPELEDLESQLPNPTLIAFDLSEFTEVFSQVNAAPSNDLSNASKLSQQVLTQGRFNINSTSATAWAAVLSSGVIEDFEYVNYVGNETDPDNKNISEINRIRSFTRFPNSQQETFDAPVTPTTVSYFGEQRLVNPSEFYRIGSRRFTSDEIIRLAIEIASLVKENSQPFLSMEDFLSPLPSETVSLIEKAIANTLNTDGRQKWRHSFETLGEDPEDSSQRDIDHFAPAFLTQADILTSIGNFLSPRSDTFKIRARGDSLTIMGDVASSVILEATVQRIPTPHNSYEASQTSTTRQFKILQTRVIESKDI